MTRVFADGPDSFFAWDSGAEWTFQRPAGNRAGPPGTLVYSQGTQRLELHRVEH